ncbi:MAG: radical SAM protein [Planctomycetota bacterium]|jgi:MoaA/NifB/PqqE/SkfB family radical SAM enzyme
MQKDPQPTFPIPQHMELEITQACGYNCHGCLFADKVESDIPEMGTDAWRRAVANYATMLGDKFGLITIIGGEPTKRDDLPEVVEGITSHPNLGMILLTDGRYIHRPAKRGDKTHLVKHLTKAGMLHVGVSIDSIAEDRKKRGETEFNSGKARAFNSLEALRKIKREQEEQGVEGILYANCVINRENMANGAIFEVYETLAQEGFCTNFTAFQWLKYGNYDSPKRIRKEDETRIQEVAEELLRVRQTSGNRIINSIDYLSKLPEYSIEQRHTCSRPSILQVDPAGTIAFCVGSKGEIGDSQKFNLLTFDAQTFHESYTPAWRADKKNGACKSCTFSCLGRAGDYTTAGTPVHLRNVWDVYVQQEERLEDVKAIFGWK